MSDEARHGSDEVTEEEELGAYQLIAEAERALAEASGALIQLQYLDGWIGPSRLGGVANLAMAVSRGFGELHDKVEANQGLKATRQS